MAVAQTSLSSFIAPGNLEKERLTSLSIFRQAVVVGFCMSPSEQGDANQSSLITDFEAVGGMRFSIRFEDVQRFSADGFESRPLIGEVHNEVYYSSRTKVSRVKLMFEGERWSMSFTCSAIIVVE